MKQYCSNLLSGMMAILMAGIVNLGCGPAVKDGLEAMDLGVTEQAVAYNGHDYLFVTTPKTWHEAQQHCKTIGYHLVTINDASEESFLETQESYRGLRQWWIGYTDASIEGIWIWADGSSSYTNWAPTQPDNDRGEQDCGVDRWSGSQWDDEQCWVPHPFVCESEFAATSNRGSFSYGTSNTSNATVNTSNYAVYLFAGQLFTVGTCGVPGSSRSGDTWLRLNNPSGQEIASNDDSGGDCGVGSNISIVVPSTGSYVIRAGCYSSGSCGGTVAFNY